MGSGRIFNWCDAANLQSENEKVFNMMPNVHAGKFTDDIEREMIQWEVDHTSQSGINLNWSVFGWIVAITIFVGAGFAF
jgi:hypothetical protein